MDPDRPAAPRSAGAGATIVSGGGPHREGQRCVERPDLLDQIELVLEGGETTSRVAKIDMVILYGFCVNLPFF